MQVKVQLDEILTALETNAFVALELATTVGIQSVSNAKERLAEIDKERRKAEVDLQKAENQIEQLNDEIAGHDTADLARKRQLQQESLKEEGRLQTNIANVRKDIDQVRDELALAQKAIEGLASARTQRSTLRVSIATDLERTFTASIERLRDKLRTKVEQFATSAFKKMTTQPQYRSLEINSNYGLSIIDAAGRKVSACDTAGISTPSSKHLIDTKMPPNERNHTIVASRSPAIFEWYSIGSKPCSLFNHFPPELAHRRAVAAQFSATTALHS
jgi:hypothetical protein